MIADEREGPIETAFKMLTAPVWVPIYFAYVGCRKLAEAWSRRKPKPVEPEILSPVQPWQPSREFEPGEASRRVAQLEGVIRKARKGREVLISLH